MKTIFTERTTGRQIEYAAIPAELRREMETHPEAEVETTDEFPYSLRTVCAVCGASVHGGFVGTSQYATCANGHRWQHSFDGSVGWIRRE